MPYERPSDLGFSVMDGNADPIAHALVRRLRDASAEMERDVNRLFQGRHAVDLGGLAMTDLERTIKRLAYMAETLREVQKAQAHGVTYLQAAE
jgi:hypothetical protein